MAKDGKPCPSPSGDESLHDRGTSRGLVADTHLSRALVWPYIFPLTLFLLGDTPFCLQCLYMYLAA